MSTKCMIKAVHSQYSPTRILKSKAGYDHGIPILDGNSEKGAHVRSILCTLICLRHLIRSRAVTDPFFSPKRPNFLHVCTTCSELPSNISTMGKTMGLC